MSNEITNFYETYIGSCPFIESECDELRIKNWELMKAYAAKANVSVFDAQDREYLYYCHCCGQDLDSAYAKGEMYCSLECECAIEDDGYKCNFHDCLICQEEREHTPPFLEKIKKFYYLSGCASNDNYGVHYYRHIEEIALHENMTMRDAFSFIITARRPKVSALESFELFELSKDDMNNLETYARDYGVTLSQAYKAQHKCQHCFADVLPETYGPEHQFCNAWCNVCYDVKPHHKECAICQGNEEDCRACNGEVYYLNQEVLRREQFNAVDAAAFAFQELNIYNQVYDSLFDLSEYIF